MTIDATFWVAVSFFIFIGGLIYLKVPNKINVSLNDQITRIKKELDEAEKLKIEAKNLLSDYESKIDKSKKETRDILNLAKKQAERTILEKTEKFHVNMDNKKKMIEQKILQMRESALKDIKITSIMVSMETVENLIKNSIDKNKIEKIYEKSLEDAMTALKHSKV